MGKFLDSFWRAALYCLHPRVIALSILPLAIMAAIALGLGYFFWDEALVMVRAHLEGFELVTTMLGWLERFGLSNLRVVLAPIIVLFLAIPVIAIASLLFVAWMMTPAMVSLVGDRRFPKLERKNGGSILTSVAWSLGSTLLAIIALCISIPLWLIPPLILVLPPLIWGWLTYRVMSYDALVVHASADERKQVFKEHRAWLLGIGVISGYLGAAPSVLWASGALFIAMAPILVPVAIWIYTLVFAFSSLWFAHYTLAALQELRAKNEAEAAIVRTRRASDQVVIEGTPPPLALPPADTPGPSAPPTLMN
jgi:Etoposide-induced protein 2.4 (EI24)